MPGRRLTAEEAATELKRRFEEARQRLTPEAIADGHEHQLRVLKCEAQSIIMLCSRRAGKSRACAGLLALTALKTPGCSSLYLALTKGQAEKIYRRHWKPMLRKFKVPCTHSGTMTTFPNGATVTFGGTDDDRTVTHLLGDSMAGGIAILDEQQSDPGLLEEILKNTIGPMIFEQTSEVNAPGRLVVSGTVPDKPEGYFWQLWTENYDDKVDRMRPDAGWAAFTWSRFSNPHTHGNNEQLENYLKRTKLDKNDPVVQRNWFGKRIWNDNGSLLGASWEPSVHVIRPFAIPPGWEKFRAGVYSYGPYPKLASIVWFAVDTFGNFTAYRSLACEKRNSAQLAADIRALEMETPGEWDAYNGCSRLTGPLWHTAFGAASHTGKTAAETMGDAGIFWEEGDKDIGQFVEQMRVRLTRRTRHPTRKGVVVPGLRFFDTCWNYVRDKDGKKVTVGPIATLPTLQGDPKHPEAWDKTTCDFDAIAVGLACVWRELPAENDTAKLEPVDEEMNERRRRAGRSNGAWSGGGYIG